MKVVSVNISKSATIKWRGKEVTTGIYKKPVDHPILLKAQGVENDTVIDHRYHGGIYKACYLYSADYYEYWKSLYPNLDWTYGMFGENITIAGMDESKLSAGEKYRLGEALVEITKPREPCYKLGVKFGNQKVLRDFIRFGHPGSYVRVLEAGLVKSGDPFELTEKSTGTSIKQTFDSLYEKE
ncbi:MAG: MOSC domain-containing protein [Bacteroidota bacterium]